MAILKPDYYIQSYRTLDCSRLKKAGIRLLLCDIDNTLMAYNESKPTLEVVAFIERVKACGIEVALCSNATKKRAMRFSEDLHVSQVYYLSCKPLPFRFWQACREHGYKHAEVAILGDQLFTDMLGGNFAGVYTILTAPISHIDRGSTKLTRKAEAVAYCLMKHTGFRKGEYDD